MSSIHPAATRLVALLALTALVLGACGAAATPAPDPTSATSAPTPVVTAPAATLAAGGTWTITGGSKATVRVREQLVGVSAPSDAVLVASGGKGSFSLKPDGTFSDDSRLSFDLSTLASDQRGRDDFSKRTTLAVQQFPTADLVPVKATGLTVPLPASGDFTFKLAGKLTIHGVTKDVTFDVVAKRAAGDLTATATLNPAVKFGDFGMTAPSVPTRVISVVDEIRLVVDLVASGPAN